MASTQVIPSREIDPASRLDMPCQERQDAKDEPLEGKKPAAAEPSVALGGAVGSVPDSEKDEPLEGKKPAVDLPADEQSREAEEAEEAEEAGEEGQEDASKPLQGNRVYQYEIPIGDFVHEPPPAVTLPTVHPRKNSLGFESNSSTALVKPLPPDPDQAALVNAPCEDQALDDIEEVCDPVSDLQEFLQNYYEADPAAGYLSGAGLEGMDNPSPFGGDCGGGGGGGGHHGLGVAAPKITKKVSGNPLSGALSAALAAHSNTPAAVVEEPSSLERRHSYHFGPPQQQIYLGSVVGFGYPGGPKIHRSLSTSSGQALTHHQQVSGGSAGSGGRSSGGARGPRGSSSRYRGVTQHRRTKRWEAHVWDQGKQVYLGGFESEERAGRAYDLVVLKCRGAGARTNFAGEDYTALLPYLTSVTRDELVHLLRRRSKGFSKGSSKYTGVTKHKCGKWEARISCSKSDNNGGRKYSYLGLYETEVAAAIAHDRAAVTVNGHSAATNFPVTNYQEELQRHNPGEREHNQLSLHGLVNQLL